MILHRSILTGMGSVLMLTSALAGCATYAKCGSNDCSGDAKITANVQSLLNRHPDLEGPNSIEVQTKDHIVYLNGYVATGLQSQTAASVAQQAPGVTQVVNLITVEH